MYADKNLKSGKIRRRDVDYLIKDFQNTCDACLNYSTARPERGVISECFPCFVLSTRKACSTNILMT